jgi:hypothetical protein
VRWHAEGEDPVFKAVILKILVKMALIAVQNKQPVCPYLARLRMRVKLLQPLEAKRVVRPAVSETESFQLRGISGSSH